MIGQVQHITFNEFLPRVLGRNQLATFGLDLSPGYYDKYDPQCSAQIFTEFATAAFRYELVVQQWKEGGRGGVSSLSNCSVFKLKVGTVCNSTFIRGQGYIFVFLFKI